jgi:uncharacterized protein (UPF0147 family)
MDKLNLPDMNLADVIQVLDNLWKTHNLPTDTRWAIETAIKLLKSHLPNHSPHVRYDN